MANSYQKSGVDYSKLDTHKVSALQAAKTTGKNIDTTAFTEVTESRGESAYVIEHDNHYLAMVQEGLGTKSLVADAVRAYTNKTHYDALAIDTVAMIVNDLITVGARPLTIQQYLACGDSNWLDDTQRMNDLIQGWKQACNEVGASWGGGETPALKGIINENVIDLAGNAVGIIQPKNRLLLGKNIQDGDAMLGFASSGIHANGLSLARSLATKLKDGYQTKLSNDSTYGEALLEPTILYSSLLQALFNAELSIHYAVNVTGHGWRKLMRPTENFTYTVDTITPAPEVLNFIQQETKMSDREAYATFNMGLGFCVYLPKSDVATALRIAKKQNIPAWEIGHISSAKTKSVVIKPLDITYTADELEIR